MAQTLRALIVDDSADDAEILRVTLERGGYQVAWRRVDDAAALAAALGEPWDLILCDHNMPCLSAPVALALVRERGLDLPFVIVSGAIGEELAVEAMRAGAQDYLMKDRLTRLPAVVDRELKELDMRRAHAAARKELEYLAFHDRLTGLPNRISFDRLVDEAIRERHAGVRPAAVLMATLVGFRDIVNAFGSELGDRAVIEASRRLRGAVPGAATAARLGPSAFGVLLPESDSVAAAQAAEDILKAFHVPCRLGELTLEIEPCVGIALYPAHGQDSARLIREADVALDEARSRGGGSWALYRPEEDPSKMRRLAILGELRRAIAEDELILDYQPKVELPTARIEGVEALVRWRHPRLGVLPPGEFVPLAETGGLAGPLTRWVLATALRQKRSWDSEGRGLQMAVNVSARNIRDPGFLADLEDELRTSRATGEGLIVEVTETAVMRDMARARDVMARLAQMGVRAALDDFGTGYSSLAVLQGILASEMKIDRSFVTGALERDADRAIVRASGELAHGLGMRVCAEGVETRAVLELLADLGCDAAQGYYIARPMSADAVIAWADAAAARSRAAGRPMRAAGIAAGPQARAATNPPRRDVR